MTNNQYQMTSDKRMNSINTIQTRMENIRTIFEDAKNYAAGCDDLDGLIKHIENTSSEFRSVAYEGAAMSLALKDFSSNNALKLWNSLLKISQHHEGQVHIGLGWAIAEAKPGDLSFMKTIHSKIAFRVWDGCGYYNGIFRQRQTIKNQTRQDYISENNFKSYDQGIGRSMWYNCKGHPAKVAETIQTFSVSRQDDLWRGVGIACSFAGGCDANILSNLFSLAGKNSVHLSLGAIMVAKSRSQANTVTKHIELVCKVWCNLSVQDAELLFSKAESSADSFESFLSKMEAEITNVNSVV
ncbi:MAG TPA: DUF1702 family protein [Bacteroidia bacterium]|nr:DUF1702 family protein [Bacteroidia bacterium]